MMIESWVADRNLLHLNNTDKCEGRYTFGNPGGGRSAIDHILINGEAQQNYKGMRIDENKEELKKKVKNTMSFKGMMAVITVTQERNLKKTSKIQIGKKGKEEVLTAPWMDREGRYLIKLRKIKIRTWRKSRRANATRRVLSILKRKYEAEKKITSEYLGKRKHNWEKEMIRRAHENNKVLWNFAKEIQGTKRKMEEKTHIYVEEEKKEVQEVWNMFVDT